VRAHIEGAHAALVNVSTPDGAISMSVKYDGGGATDNAHWHALHVCDGRTVVITVRRCHDGGRDRYIAFARVAADDCVGQTAPIGCDLMVSLGNRRILWSGPAHSLRRGVAEIAACHECVEIDAVLAFRLSGLLPNPYPGPYPADSHDRLNLRVTGRLYAYPPPAAAAPAAASPPPLGAAPPAAAPPSPIRLASPPAPAAPRP
jgi:hypothetical protein